MSLVSRTVRQRTRTTVHALAWCQRSYASSSSSSSPTSIEHHDLVIVGGGPAGLVLAAALASSETIAQNHKITLLEGNSLDATKAWNPLPNQLSNRVSSITARNRDWLSRIGVWRHVDESRTRDVHDMQVWDGLSDARIQFQSPLVSTTTTTRIDPMATLTENLNLQRAALRRIDERSEDGSAAAVELVDGFKVESIVKSDKEGGSWPIVNLSNKDGTVKKSIRARLLIGADGANSPVKTYSDIETFGWKYDRHGVVASLDLDPSIDGRGTRTAWQRFLPEGPIAFLPLSDTTASLVWSTTPTCASLLKSLPSPAFARLINLAFSLPYDQLSRLVSHLSELSSTEEGLPPVEQLVASLDDVYRTHFESTYDAGSGGPLDAPLPPLVSAIQPSTTASFPLRLSHTSSYLGLPCETNHQDVRTVLVGDAAHTIHPLAGQGLNMGLNDCCALVSTLERSTELGRDVGSYVGLLEYPRSRYVENHALLSACDHLASLYASRNPAIVWLRTNGLEVVNELPAVKNLLMGGAGASSSSFSSSASSSSRGAGWGLTATAFEQVARVKDVVGLIGGIAAGAIKKRATEFVVKGR